MTGTDWAADGPDTESEPFWRTAPPARPRVASAMSGFRGAAILLLAAAGLVPLSDQPLAGLEPDEAAILLGIGAVACTAANASAHCSAPCPGTSTPARARRRGTRARW